jgi:hypothetical protein
MPDEPSPDPAESLAIAQEQAMFMRRSGATPDQVIRAVGIVPAGRVGWDDAVVELGKALHALRWGTSPVRLGEEVD